MSTVQLQPDADPLYARPLPQRPFYATGMLLDARDFSDEQTYHRGRLAEAIGFLSGGGTLAGLRIRHEAAAADGSTPEEIRVEPGVAVDRLGRLIELPRPACLRLQRWFDATLAADGGDTLHAATRENPSVLLSPRLQGEAGSDGLPPLPERAVVADVFLRFVACPQGLTPSFASGPYDALDAVATSRLQDAYELLLLARTDVDTDPASVFTGLPAPPAVLPATTDAARRAAVQDAILAGWQASGRSSREGELAPLPEQPASLADRSAVFLGRVLIPVTADGAPRRDGTGVLADNWSRRFIPSNGLLGCWLGL